MFLTVLLIQRVWHKFHITCLISHSWSGFPGGTRRCLWQICEEDPTINLSERLKGGALSVDWTRAVRAQLIHTRIHKKAKPDTRLEKFSLGRGLIQMSWIFALVITLPAVTFAVLSLCLAQSGRDPRKIHRTRREVFSLSLLSSDLSSFKRGRQNVGRRSFRPDCTESSTEHLFSISEFCCRF
jgi:hypothetical protein